MKVAFLILAHDRPHHLYRLIKSLDHHKFDFFVYIDKNSDINLFKDALKDFDNCFFADKREKILWGSYRQMKVMLELLKMSTKKGTYGRFQHLSGNDYPIKSSKKIYEFYEQNASNYISTWEIIRKEASVKTHKLYRYSFNNYPFLNKIHGQRLANITKRSLVVFLSNLFKFIARYLLPKRELPFDLLKGSNWFSINAVFAKSLLSWIETQEGKDLLEFTKFAACPDEFFINTFGNMYFKDDIAKIDEKNVHAVHFVEWDHGSGKPQNLRAHHFEDLIKSSALFARKFDRGSEELIKKLDFIKEK